MCKTTKNELAIKLITILNKLTVGRYELEYDTKKNRFELVLYNIADYGIYSAIYVPEHIQTDNALIRLDETIIRLNKHG